jgi:hypothetical protein
MAGDCLSYVVLYLVDRLALCEDRMAQGTRMGFTVDGRRHEVDLAKESRRLATATPEHLRRYELSPTGYGIHWPDVDEDLSVDGLVHAAQAVTPAEAKLW